MNLSGFTISLGLAIGFFTTRWLFRRRRRYSLEQWRAAMIARGIATRNWTGWKEPPLDFRKRPKRG